VLSHVRRSAEGDNGARMVASHVQNLENARGDEFWFMARPFAMHRSGRAAWRKP